MRSLVLAQIVALPLIVLAAVPATAQPTPAPASYRIAGTVASESTGQPLQKVTIQIGTGADPKLHQSATSDENGRFAFTGVPAGNFNLSGSAPGYLETHYEQHGNFSTGIVTGPGVDTESLVLKLLPEGVITGTVLDESAEPVQNAQVHLFRRTHDFGDNRIESASQQSTDDLGHFEFPRLPPDDYLLAVTAQPWYAVHPILIPSPSEQYRGTLVSRQGNIIISAAQMSAMQQAGFVDSVDPTLDVAYPITYYPSVTHSDQATPIPVRGAAVDVSLRLTPVPAVSVSFPFTQPEPNQSINFPQLRSSIFGQVEFASGQELQQTGNQMIIAGLAPGDYVVSDPRQPMNQGAGTALHLDRSATAAPLPATPELAHLRVVLQTTDGSPAPDGTQVGIAPPGATEYPTLVRSTNGEATLEASPGDYFFQVRDPKYSSFVRLVFAGTQPLTGTGIHIASAGDLTFTVIYAAGTHSVRGIAQKDSKPADGAFLLLFPASEIPTGRAQSKDDAHSIRTFFLFQSDLDGSFEFTGLAPGNYVLLAIDNGWDLDWQQPAVLARYLPTAIRVRVPDSRTLAQTLPAPIPVQPK